MAISKVNYGSNVLMDLTGDTVDAEHLAEGYTAHDKTGVLITGTMTSGGGASGEEYSVRWSGKLSSCGGMFANNKSISSIDVSNLDTSQVTKMNSMFNNCQSLTSLDVSNFDTSKVTDMSSMFNSCISLTSLDVSNFDTSQVTKMNTMFFYCRSLTSLDVSNFDTSKVTNTSNMFNACQALTNFTSCVFRTSVSFNGSNKLSHASLMSIINNLARVTTSQTLTIGTTNKAKLASNEIAIATNKGWTVA